MAKSRGYPRENAPDEEASSLEPTSEEQNATTTAKVRVQLPAELDLSEDQLKTLHQNFASHFVDFGHVDADAATRAARPKVVKTVFISDVVVTE